MQFVLKVLVATTMVHVFIYTPYTNQLIKQVNQISFKYQKLACYLYWLVLTVNNVSIEVGTWVDGKAVPCTVPAIWAIVSLNSISTKRMVFKRYEKISLSNDMLQTNVYKPWKSQDCIVLEGLFPSSISKTLQQWKYDLQSWYIYIKLKNDRSP